jgi:hypothetical protein
MVRRGRERATPSVVVRMPFELDSRPIILLGLLVGPTLIWQAYRLWIGPKFGRPIVPDTTQYVICDRCQSLTPIDARRCYKCRLPFDEGQPG